MTEYKRKTKVCSNCDQDLLLEFYRKIKNRNGNFTIHHECKDCTALQLSKDYFKHQMDKYIAEHKNGYFLLKCSIHGNLEYDQLYIKRYKSRKKYNYKAECIQCESDRRARSYGEHNISLHGKEIICNACKENKSFISFHYAELKQKYPRCHDCGVERARRHKRATRVYRLKDGIKITKEWYDNQFKIQNGLCFICNKSDLTRKLSVDHCHKTKKLRSLLCKKCNLALGQLNDSSSLLRKAADYLDFHNEKP